MDETSIRAAAVHDGRRIELSFLLDSGQMYTCLPQWACRELGLTEKRRQTLHLSDGSPRSVSVGECTIQTDDLGEVTTPVILGDAGDHAVFGVLTLAELGFVLDPLTRAVRPAVVRLSAPGPVGRGRIPSEAGLADPPRASRPRGRE